MSVAQMILDLIKAGANAEAIAVAVEAYEKVVPYDGRRSPKMPAEPLSVRVPVRKDGEHD